MSASPPPRLQERVLPGANADAILERFLEWTTDIGLELYPHQEEAILELFAGKHVILKTPTGSGKTLVALAAHFKALCEDSRAFYTAPIKALVSEKFFDWADALGAENVGMMTGDAGINSQAPVVCCTAEILSNLALREGRYAPVDIAILDEFHYYADRDRGIAWQIPLLELPDTQFLLMSATLGDMRRISEDLEKRTGREVAVVANAERPVPLDYKYLELRLPHAIEQLARENRLPVYIVNFTQREAAEQAQALTSVSLCSKEEREAIKEAVGHFRYDTPYGKDMRRFISHGIGLHHAGLLPKYRLLVERLAQKGLLKVISGTDTLGVGVNVPIRTVLFTKLYKFDGEQMGLLSVRDFQQIAGRAGRKGFDEQGSVVCLAPEHVVDNKEKEAKTSNKTSGGKRKVVKSKPPKGYVPYNADTFYKLSQSQPEELRSSFEVTNNLLANVLQRELTFDQPHGGYRRLIELIGRSHESEAMRKRHRRRAAQLFRALRRANLLELTPVDFSKRKYVRLKEDLQKEFSLHHTLSLYLVEASGVLDPKEELYPHKLLSLVEAILENPQPILLRQLDKIKGDKVAEMKAAGMDYEDRMAELEKLTWPKPEEDLIYETFDAFREHHPWVREDNVRPKCIARDMYERYASFSEYDRLYGLQRIEGRLLRYLSECYKVLVQTVPNTRKTDPVHEMIAYLRAMLGQVDNSLIREWESLLLGEVEEGEALGPQPPRPLDPSRDSRTFHARLRAEMHRLVKALAQQDWEEAALAVWQPDDEADGWTPKRFQEAMEPFFAEHEALIFDHRARLSEHTLIQKGEGKRWRVRQTLLDPAGDNMWSVDAQVDLTEPPVEEGPLLRIEAIGP